MHLTPRQLEVIQWLALGKTETEIADILKISKHAVKFHFKQVAKAFDVYPRHTRVVALAVGMGLVTHEEVHG